MLLDLQGPKPRLGVFADGPVTLAAGHAFRVDMDHELAGDKHRVALPHAEIHSALEVGTEPLIDDGRVRLRVKSFGPERAETRVVIGGRVSDRKGVNVPGVVLPLSAVTAKDHADLEYGLSLGVDWIALSFVQRAEYIAGIKAIVGGRAGIVAKLEKPAAIASLEAIVAASDAAMLSAGSASGQYPLGAVAI